MGGIPMWDRTQAIRWLQGLDLGQYADKVKDGSSIVSDPEKSLGMTNPFHKKKLRLAIRALDDELVLRNNLIKTKFFLRNRIILEQDGSATGLKKSDFQSIKNPSTNMESTVAF